ncbi:MAG: cobalamin B12-binding domain-containing protein [Steroidobacteraceae bacterium]
MTDESAEQVRSRTNTLLLGQLRADIYHGATPAALAAIEVFLACGWDPNTLLEEGLLRTLRAIDGDARDGVLFVPEALRAIAAIETGVKILRPLIGRSVGEPFGTAVIGVVSGDKHDIGKDIVAMTLERAGFTIVDLGTDTPSDAFLEALRVHHADVLVLSTQLTAGIPHMKALIERMCTLRIRQRHLVLVGGTPLNEEFAKAVGADAYCRDAATCAETARSLLAARRAGEASGICPRTSGTHDTAPAALAIGSG